MKLEVRRLPALMHLPNMMRLGEGEVLARSSAGRSGIDITSRLPFRVLALPDLCKQLSLLVVLTSCFGRVWLFSTCVLEAAPLICSLLHSLAKPTAPMFCSFLWGACRQLVPGGFQVWSPIPGPLLQVVLRRLELLFQRDSSKTSLKVLLTNMFRLQTSDFAGLNIKLGQNAHQSKLAKAPRRTQSLGHWWHSFARWIHHVMAQIVLGDAPAHACVNLSTLSLLLFFDAVPLSLSLSLSPSLPRTRTHRQTNKHTRTNAYACLPLLVQAAHKLFQLGSALHFLGDFLGKLWLRRF